MPTIVGVCSFHMFCMSQSDINRKSIYNDVITLRKGSGYMYVHLVHIRSSVIFVASRTKLSLSHALSQSVKISLVSIWLQKKSVTLTDVISLKR